MCCCNAWRVFNALPPPHPCAKRAGGRPKPTTVTNLLHVHFLCKNSTSYYTLRVTTTCYVRIQLCSAEVRPGPARPPIPKSRHHPTPSCAHFIPHYHDRLIGFRVLFMGRVKPRGTGPVSGNGDRTRSSRISKPPDPTRPDSSDSKNCH